jgi:hypothetical protein
MFDRRSRIAAIVRNSAKFTLVRIDNNWWLGIPWANNNASRLGCQSYILEHINSLNSPFPEIPKAIETTKIT